MSHSTVIFRDFSISNMGFHDKQIGNVGKKRALPKTLVLFIPPAFWLLRERPKAGVVDVAG